MFLLDTNIVSLFDPRRKAEAANILSWIRRNDRWLYLSVLTLTEIKAGILKIRRKGPSKRADQLDTMLALLRGAFVGRILPIDANVALQIAELGELTRHLYIGLPDLAIAATAKLHDFTVVTRNVADYVPTGVPGVDPYAALPSDIPG